MHARAVQPAEERAARVDLDLDDAGPEHGADNVEAAELFLKSAPPAAQAQEAPRSGDSGAFANTHTHGNGNGGGQLQRYGPLTPPMAMNAAFVKEHPVTAASMGMVLVLFLAGLIAREGMGERVTLILANTVRGEG